MRKIAKDELQEILEKHQKWLKGEREGIRADLSDANLRNADLRNANLRNANLWNANLSNTDLSNADLRNADLWNANLSNTDLRNANLRNANLWNANLWNANLWNANLSNTDLSNADLRNANLWNANLWNATNEFSHCPEEGSFIGFKKCRGSKIVKLLITKDSKRLSATGRKCRASKVRVLDIYDIKDKEKKYLQAESFHDQDFEYTLGGIVEVTDFDENRWNECSAGIHFFLTEKEAKRY